MPQFSEAKEERPLQTRWSPIAKTIALAANFYLDQAGFGVGNKRPCVVRANTMSESENRNPVERLFVLHALPPFGQHPIND